MLMVGISNIEFLKRSFSLAKVLCVGVNGLRIAFASLLILWGLTYMAKGFSLSVQVQATVMMVPVLLQVFIALFIGMRAAALIGNPQLHLMGLRKELYVNLLVLSLLFSVFVFDAKNSENLYAAKLLVFNYVSLGVVWMMLIFSLQLIPMIVLAVAGSLSVYLIFVVGANIAMSGLAIFVWAYVAYWLWRSPLQRQFKFEKFSGLADYCVERLKIISLKRALTVVKIKEHVVLMGEGDGYINRMLLAPIFSLVFTAVYVLALHGLRDLCLWMILLLLAGTKVKPKVILSQPKLWLLQDGGRSAQFGIAENIILRLILYPFLTAIPLLAVWCYINPELLVHGIAALCLSLLFVVAVDYLVGFAGVNKLWAFLTVFLKMGFMASFMFARFGLEWYVLGALTLVILCVVFRPRARNKFLVADLSERLA